MEWRLVYLYNYNNDYCQYRTNQSQIIPYIFLGIPNTDIRPIEEIILGPKHQTPVNVIIDLLKKSNFTDVKVLKSKASYR